MKILPSKTSICGPQWGIFTADFHSKNQRHFFLVAEEVDYPIMGFLKSLLVNEPKSKVGLCSL